MNTIYSAEDTDVAIVAWIPFIPSSVCNDTHRRMEHVVVNAEQPTNMVIVLAGLSPMLLNVY